MSAAAAAELVNQWVELMRRSEALTVDIGGVFAEQIIHHFTEQALGRGLPGVTVPPPRNEQLEREIRFTGQDAAVRRLWQQHRIVYSIDPDLWAELGDSEDSQVIPGGLFTRLPHPDPFIAFPEPLVVPLDDQQQVRMRGFFVTGRDDVGHCTTANPATDGNLMLLFGGEVESLQGKPVMAAPGLQDIIWNRCTLQNDKDRTLIAHHSAIASRFQHGTGKSYGGRFDATVVPALRRAMSLLVYLCATNAELRPLPARPAGKSRGKGAPKPPKVVAVGYQTGAVLRAHRRSASVGPALVL